MEKLLVRVLEMYIKFNRAWTLFNQTERRTSEIFILSDGSEIWRFIRKKFDILARGYMKLNI